MEDMQILINGNKDMKALMDIFNDNNTDPQLNRLVDILAYAGKLEKQLNNVTDGLLSMKKQISVMQESPTKTIIQDFAQGAENRLEEAKKYLDDVKNTIVDNAKQIVNDVKQRGFLVVHSTINFLDIKEVLKVAHIALISAENQLNRVMKELDKLEQKHSVIKDLKSRKEQKNAKEISVINKTEKKDLSL